MSPKKLYLYGFSIIFIMTLIAAFVIHEANQSRVALDFFGEVPDFTLTDQNGKHFGKNDLRGKINIVDFIFTSCQEACPIMSGQMARLYEAFEGSSIVQFVSISVDPETDSLSVMRKYLESFGVKDERWIFLNGHIEDIKILSEKGFMLAADNLPSMHSTKFILVDDNAKIRGYYESKNDNSIKILIRHIRELGKRIS